MGAMASTRIAKPPAAVSSTPVVGSVITNSTVSGNVAQVGNAGDNNLGGSGNDAAVDEADGGGIDVGGACASQVGR